MTKEEYFNPAFLCEKLKSFELVLRDLNDMDSAISTAGGICFSSLKNNFELKKFNGLYVSGEMIDWEAPTGGFLIQGCYAISNRIIQDLLRKKRQR